MLGDMGVANMIYGTLFIHFRLIVGYIENGLLQIKDILVIRDMFFICGITYSPFCNIESRSVKLVNMLIESGKLYELNAFITVVL